MKTQYLISLFLIIFFIQVDNIQAKDSEVITLCHEDIEVHPWLSKTGQGLLDIQIKQIQKITKLKIKLLSLPWKRCQLKTQMGEINGVLSATYTTDRTSWAQYPLDDKNKPQREYRLHSDSFIIYVNKHSNVQWINGQFKNSKNIIVGVQLGYSAQEELVRMGIPVYTSFSTTPELLRAVSSNFIPAAVLQKHATDLALKNNPEYSKNIKTMSEPFKTVDQYIIFNKFYYSKHQAIAQQIWKATKIARESTEYQDRLKELLK